MLGFFFFFSIIIELFCFSLGDPSIDWEESVYLNLILHQVSSTNNCTGDPYSVLGLLTLFRSWNSNFFMGLHIIVKLNETYL